jgi:nucleoside-diphosphate-sugar epimerase
VGRRLLRLLRERGYDVVGTTRSDARLGEIERSGARPVLLDAFDREAVARTLDEVRPDAVIHQMTDLSGGFAPDRVAATLARNSRLRIEGTRNLVDAARSSDVRRLIAQSIAWAYAASDQPHREGDPLDQDASGERATTVRGVVALEEALLRAAPVEGIMLRYGWLYGPGASAAPAGRPGLHVDAAALAAVLAIEHGSPGVYNVAEPGPEIAVDKACRDLHWDPAFRQAW